MRISASPSLLPIPILTKDFWLSSSYVDGESLFFGVYMSSHVLAEQLESLLDEYCLYHRNASFRQDCVRRIALILFPEDSNKAERSLVFICELFEEFLHERAELMEHLLELPKQY